jgi:hypothetical protein
MPPSNVKRLLINLIRDFLVVLNINRQGLLSTKYVCSFAIGSAVGHVFFHSVAFFVFIFLFANNFLQFFVLLMLRIPYLLEIGFSAYNFLNIIYIAKCQIFLPLLRILIELRHALGLYIYVINIYLLQVFHIIWRNIHALV